MCCFVQVTRQWNETVDTQEYVKSVCYVATLAPSGRKVVGIWLLPMEQTEVGSLRIAGNFETNLFLSDFSFGLCHITEEELKQDKFGSPELIECGSGVFWDPDLECPAAKSLLNFSPAEFEQELQAKQKSEQEAKMLEKKRKKQEQDEEDAKAYEELRERLEAEKSNLVVPSGKRRRAAHEAQKQMPPGETSEEGSED
jgi:hypothetical protein